MDGSRLAKGRATVPNIDKDESEALKKLAAYLMSLPAAALAKAILENELLELDCDAQNQISHS